jgi:hypothetical protein
MVYCGRPSKACQRCRRRKLRCGLQRGSCGQCLRAKVACTGYRDMQQLRIRNESQAIERKFIVLPSRNSSGNANPFEPRSFPLSIDTQARDVFFAYHVTGRPSITWEFLRQFSNPVHSPEHLTLSIDVVSLAYLSHQLSYHLCCQREPGAE